MRIDHIAYRVADRNKTAKFFIDAFGYKIDPEIPEGFDITFEDGSKAKCLVLLPPEKALKNSPWEQSVFFSHIWPEEGNFFKKVWSYIKSTISSVKVDYHMAPEIFISDGSDGSIVKEWVKKRDGVGGIHHIAYQVKSVQDTMNMMRSKGYAEFTTQDPLTCPGLVQVFTKPSELTGVIYEFIEREAQGFCKDNVKDLMKSTKGL